MNCGGRNYRMGCTCGDCHTLYIARHASSCSYGTDPRLTAAAASPTPKPPKHANPTTTRAATTPPLVAAEHPHARRQP
jgi:hypothetical protein